MKNKKAYFTTKWITYTAMATALVVATSYIPPIPMPPLGSLYWCDGVIFTAAYLLDPIAAFLTGGIGTFLYDVIHGNSAMMFASLIIHGLQGAAVSAFLRFIPIKRFETLRAAIASLVGAAIVIGGYYILRRYVQGLEPEVCGLKAVANVIQEAVGVAIGMILCYATTLKARLEKQNLLPNFRREVLKSTPADGGESSPPAGGE